MEGAGTPPRHNFASNAEGATRTLADIWGSRRAQDGDDPKQILADIWSGDGHESVENPQLSDITDGDGVLQADDLADPSFAPAALLPAAPEGLLGGPELLLEAPKVVSDTPEPLLEGPEVAFDVPEVVLEEEQYTEYQERRQAPEDPERLLFSAESISPETELNLANRYLQDGRFADAIPLLERIAAALDPVDPSHLITLNSVRASLAMAYALTGRPALAVPLYQTLLEGGSGLVRQSDLLTYRIKLAVAQREVGDVTEALDLLENMLTELATGDGTHRVRAVEAQVELATTYVAAGRTEDGVWMYERVMPDVARTHGSSDRETLTVRVLLARAYDALGDTGQAISVYRDVLSIAEPALGLRDLLTACAYDEVETLLRSRVG